MIQRNRIYIGIGSYLHWNPLGARRKKKGSLISDSDQKAHVEYRTFDMHISKGIREFMNISISWQSVCCTFLPRGCTFLPHLKMIIHRSLLFPVFALRASRVVCVLWSYQNVIHRHKDSGKILCRMSFVIYVLFPFTEKSSVPWIFHVGTKKSDADGLYKINENTIVHDGRNSWDEMKGCRNRMQCSFINSERQNLSKRCFTTKIIFFKVKYNINHV